MLTRKEGKRSIRIVKHQRKPIDNLLQVHDVMVSITEDSIDLRDVHGVAARVAEIINYSPKGYGMMEPSITKQDNGDVLVRWKSYRSAD